MTNVLLVTCVACGKQDNVSPSSARDLFLWGVRDFCWLRPTVLCLQCLWEIQSQTAGGAGLAWLQGKLPMKARGERDDLVTP